MKLIAGHDLQSNGRTDLLSVSIDPGCFEIRVRIGIIYRVAAGQAAAGFRQIGIECLLGGGQCILHGSCRIGRGFLLFGEHHAHITQMIAQEIIRL